MREASRRSFAGFPSPRNGRCSSSILPAAMAFMARDELRAFAELPPIAEEPDRSTLQARDARHPARRRRTRPAGRFGAAIEELQAHVGASFALAQGGLYSSPMGAEIVGELHKAGFSGSGQSSWGPTLYAFSDRTAADVAASIQRIGERLDLPNLVSEVTRADNQGASIESAS